MTQRATQELAPLVAYDPDEQGSLGVAEYPEFDEFVVMPGHKAVNPVTVWKRLAALSAYAADLPSPAVGRLTPGSKQGFKPFMFGPSDEVATMQAPTLMHAHLALDSLYSYMDYPGKLVIVNFGPKSRSVVHEFLNHRIEGQD